MTNSEIIISHLCTSHRIHLLMTCRTTSYKCMVIFRYSYW
nr:MAG TPA: hypothetical protein [Caudoviricetes sp.]